MDRVHNGGESTSVSVLRRGAHVRPQRVRPCAAVEDEAAILSGHSGAGEGSGMNGRLKVQPVAGGKGAVRLIALL